jgi:hypothetical protein
MSSTNAHRCRHTQTPMSENPLSGNHPVMTPSGPFFAFFTSDPWVRIFLPVQPDASRRNTGDLTTHTKAQTNLILVFRFVLIPRPALQAHCANLELRRLQRCRWRMPPASRPCRRWSNTPACRTPRLCRRPWASVFARLARGLVSIELGHKFGFGHEPPAGTRAAV